MINSLQITIVKLTGLHCQACQMLTSRRIASIPGVENVKVDLNKSEAIIEASRVIALEEVKKSLEGTGYEANL